MAVWTIVPDSAQLPDQPIKSTDQIAIKNNITALAEGASGAPRILTAAYDNLSVTNAKLANDAVTNVKVVNSTLGAEKFQTGGDESAWVLARTSSSTAGVIGTYGFFRFFSASPPETLTPGDNVSGVRLEWSSAGGSTTGTQPSGTWKCMGHAVHGDPNQGDVTLFLRIA